MSDVKAEETPVLMEIPMTAEEAPAVSTAETSTAAEPAKTEETAPAPAPETAAVEEAKPEEKKEEPAEVKPITEGYLEFKPPGFLHFIPSKKYFYLQDEPITVENLQTYLKKDKSPAAHPNVAFASQSGKGLFFYTKNQEQKAHPTGIIKLADVVEVTTTGATKFALKMANDVLHFESFASARDGWVATIKAKVAEAKEVAESITNSEGYKATLEKLAKPVGAAKAPEPKDKEPEEAKDKEAKDKEAEAEKKEEDKEKEEKKDKEKVKSDSSSSSSSGSDDEGPSDKDKKGKKVKRTASKKAKRTSFFAIMGGGKDKKHPKEEKKEEKKEEEKKEEEKKEEEAKNEEAKPEAAAETSAPAEETKPAEEAKPEEAPKSVEPPAAEPAAAPKSRNRHSVFGFLSKKEPEKKKEEEVKPEEAKIEPIAEAPAATTDEAKPVEAPAAAPAESGSKSPASPPKDSFFDKFFKSKSTAAAPAPVAETKKEETAEAKPEETATSEAPKETAEVKPEAKAEATSPKEAKRRSSFFTSLGGKKEKKSEVKSDTEDEPSSKSNPSSPLPKKLGLFRSHSKSAKDTPKEESKEEVPPVPEVAPTAAATEAPAAPAPASEANPAIGDVVPDAVTVGQTNPVQAAA